MNHRNAVLIGLVSLAVAVLAVGGVVFGPNSNKIEPAPIDVAAGDDGFTPTTRAVTTVPFELATPGTGAAPTTIAGAPPTFYNMPTTTTSTTAPPTTTTTIPLRPTLPRPESIDSLCGLVDNMASIESIFVHRDLDALNYIDLLVADLDKYVSISPPGVAPDVIALRDVAKVMANALHSAGGDVMASNVRALITAVGSASPPFERFGLNIERVSTYEQQACPGK